MDDLRVGRVIRTVRVRLGLRQVDVAARARASQSQVSLVQHGRLGDVTLPAVRRVAGALEIELPFAPRWRGPGLDRLLDAAHAHLVEFVVRLVQADGWVALPEWSFNHFGERGSVDVLAWHPAHRALLVVEVKSRIVDVQNLLATLDRKVRVARTLLPQERGWRATHVARLVVLPEGSTTREAVARQGETFRAVLPARNVEVRRWLREPRGAVAGILFVRNSAGGDAPRGGERVRRRR